MSMFGDIKVKTWSPVIPCKIPDNIVSSQFTSSKVFTPSYEKEKRPCIEQLLTNEYQRIWWQEKEIWDKRCRTKITTKQLLQRMVIRRKSKVVPPIDKPKMTKKPKKKGKVKESKDDKKEEGKSTQETKTDETKESSEKKSPK
ncbi:uncharacterized protein LOC117207841 [Bombus bifarius]|uniref:Uncharacterized protein LOC117207841 n=1 Tax=Bombus bifarius TaxID=103933 RepID=A0A6P8MPD4_9HYME|nr:uncharacterized protein LOC117160052 [Bombus vancouverensis nearcticus]XP_033304365.1 uncharacterized protein LOC117207841 [Bombus bifarius]